MNEAPRKMRDDPSPLPVNPSDLVIDPPQQAETVFRGGFALVPEFADAGGQTIKFRPFKTIHLITFRHRACPVFRRPAIIRRIVSNLTTPD
jgi:hypothetical protein